MHLLTTAPYTIAVRRPARRGAFGSLFGWALKISQHRRRRLALASLSHHLLRDIGLTRAGVRFEADTPDRREQFPQHPTSPS